MIAAVRAWWHGVLHPERSWAQEHPFVESRCPRCGQGGVMLRRSRPEPRLCVACQDAADAYCLRMAPRGETHA